MAKQKGIPETGQLSTWDTNQRTVPKEALPGIEYASGPRYQGFNDNEVDQLRMKTFSEPAFMYKGTT